MDVPDPSSSRQPWLELVRERLTPLCLACVSDARVDGGSVALLSSTGVRAVVCTTDDTSASLETVQMDMGEGPCVDVGAGPSPVLIGDLRDPHEGVAARWPFFLPQADALGVRGVFAFGLRLGSILLGTFELYRASPGALQPSDLATALLAADEIGAAIVDTGRADAGAPVEVGDIGRLAASVHQAAGMVMVQQGGTIDEAMALLRASAYAEGTSLVTVATEVVRGRRRFTEEHT